MSGFGTITMSGAVARREDFFSKQLTLCLDMRHHIVHRPTFDYIETGSRKQSRMIRRHFDRFNDTYRYESIEAIERDTFRCPYTIAMDAAKGKWYVSKIDSKAYFRNHKRFLDLANHLKNEYPNLRKRYADASSTLIAKDALVVRLKRSR